MAELVKDYLISEYEHVREWSMISCEDLSVEQSVSIPSGANNHILWELGHIVNSEDYLIAWGCAGEERLEGGWDAKFGYKSQALPDAAEYPTLEEIQDALYKGSQKTIEYVKSLSNEALASQGKNFSGSTILSILAHFMLHEAYHVGKISLLRKMLALPSVAELLVEKQSD